MLCKNDDDRPEHRFKVLYENGSKIYARVIVCTDDERMHV